MDSEAAKEGYVDALKQIVETINLNSDVEKFIEVINVLISHIEPSTRILLSLFININ